MDFKTLYKKILKDQRENREPSRGTRLIQKSFFKNLIVAIRGKLQERIIEDSTLANFVDDIIVALAIYAIEKNINMEAEITESNDDIIKVFVDFIDYPEERSNALRDRLTEYVISEITNDLKEDGKYAQLKNRFYITTLIK